MKQMIRSFAACFLLLASDAHAQSSQDLEIEDNFIYDLDADVRQERQSVFTLRIPNTPEHIRNAHILDERGREIKFRMPLEGSSKWILGTHLEGVQIELLHTFDDGTFVVSGLKDGQVFDLSSTDLFITDLEFDDQCFDLTEVEGSDLPILITVALDISGSMEAAAHDVARTLRDFINATPPSAQCKLVAFDHASSAIDPKRGITWQAPFYTGCSAYSDFPTDGLRGRGGATELALALQPLYEQYAYQSESINLMLILSDGVGAHDKGRRITQLQRTRDQAVEASGVYTIVNWLGTYNTQYPLAKLADQSIFGASAGQAGKEFFKESLGRLKAQSVLKVGACSAPD